MTEKEEKIVDYMACQVGTNLDNIKKSANEMIKLNTGLLTILTGLATFFKVPIDFLIYPIVLIALGLLGFIKTVQVIKVDFIVGEIESSVEAYNNTSKKKLLWLKIGYYSTFLGFLWFIIVLIGGDTLITNATLFLTPSKKELVEMNAILGDIVIGIIAGVITGLVTGFGVSYRFMKYNQWRDVHNYTERTVKKLENIVNELETYKFSDESLRSTYLKIHDVVDNRFWGRMSKFDKSAEAKEVQNGIAECNTTLNEIEKRIKAIKDILAKTPKDRSSEDEKKLELQKVNLEHFIIRDAEIPNTMIKAGNALTNYYICKNSKIEKDLKRFKIFTPLFITILIVGALIFALV